MNPKNLPTQFDCLDMVFCYFFDHINCSLSENEIKVNVFKNDPSFLITPLLLKLETDGHIFKLIDYVENIPNNVETYQISNPGIIFFNFSEIKKRPYYSIRYKVELKENDEAELRRLQIKELKNKRRLAVLGAIGGSALTMFGEHIKGIMHFFHQILIRK